MGSSFFVAALGYLFLVVFQPFGAYTYQHQLKYLLLLPYSLIAFVIYSLANLIIINRVKPWYVYDEVLKILWVIVLCSVLNYIYNIHFINHVGFSVSHLLSMCLYTLSISAPISAIYVLGRYFYLTGTRIDRTVEVPGPAKIITITPDTGNEILTMAQNDFLYAASDGNYTTVCHIVDGKIQNTLLRLSLKNVESQAGGAPIIRCHRSFIVNAANVVKMKGNAQGYKLFFGNVDTPVPVSRKFIDEVKRENQKR